jgi:hypothetical protein
MSDAGKKSAGASEGNSDRAPSFLYNTVRRPPIGTLSWRAASWLEAILSNCGNSEVIVPQINLFLSFYQDGGAMMVGSNIAGLIPKNEAELRSTVDFTPPVSVGMKSWPKT